MNKVSIKNIRFQAFRSFREPQSIEDLPNTGIVGIQGTNTNTGGSSGSGKSNSHTVISYALGYCPYPATALQSWLTKSPMQVELDLETPRGLVTVGRGNKTFLKILDEDRVIEGVRAVDAELSKIIPIPRDLLEALTFRKQKSSGRFLSMTDSRKKEFLSQLLGLEEIELQIEKANKKANDAQINKETYEAVVKSLTPLVSEIKEPPPIVVDKEEIQLKQLAIIKKVGQSKLDELKSALAEYRGKKQEIQDRQLIFNNSSSDKVLLDLIFEIKKCESDIKAKEAEFEANLFSIKDELEFITKSVEHTNKSALQYSVVSEKLKKFNSDIVSIKAQTCPTCKQEWMVQLEEIEHLEANIRAHEVMLKAAAHARDILLPKYIAKKEKLTKEVLDFDKTSLVTLQNRLHELKVQLGNKEESDKAARHRAINEFNAKKLKDIAALDIENFSLVTEFEEIKAAINKVDADEKGLRAYINQQKQIEFIQRTGYQDAFNKMNKLKEDIKINQRAVDEATVEYHREKDFAAVLKSFLGAIVEEVLNEVSGEANEMLKLLPNVSSTTIQFLTENITQKGSVRQEIKPVLTKNGIDIPFQSGLSGGQETSVELAVDLAIGVIIGRRTGFMPSWLILDESFEGHDVPVKEACLELLKQAAQDRVIFIIDHATELKDQFDRCIEIESKDDVSYVKEP